MRSTCRQVAARIVAPGKGILAADESTATMSARLASAGVEPVEENRRAYRELLTTTPALVQGISGIIFCDETLRQRLTDGRCFPEAVTALGILPGVKVDTGAKACPGLPGEKITEGLDGLAERLAEYARMGAAFAKWRAVIRIVDRLPSETGVKANAHALARYAAACQEAGIVPIVEPEVLMDGSHSLRSCADVTARVHEALLAELSAFSVDPAGMVLKPNMVIEGIDHPKRSTPEQVAEATVTTLLQGLPAELAGIAFLSGGQPPERATANLAAMQIHHTPWPLTFSFGRALVDPALAGWSGDPDRVASGQAALIQRVQANAEAVRRRRRPQPV
jgi:fructose-bisphosphate aldolase class I